MMAKEYSSVSLPRGLTDEIREYLSGRGCGHGYVSIGDFVKDACRRRLEEVR